MNSIAKSTSQSQAPLKVDRVSFLLAGKELFGYSANELDDNGDRVNYLSGLGLANTLELPETTTRYNRLPKGLKTMLGGNFTVWYGEYKMESGGVTKLNLWSTTASVQYFCYHAFRGNKIAQLLLQSLANTTIDTIINDAFGIPYESGFSEQKTEDYFQKGLTRYRYQVAIQKYVDSGKAPQGSSIDSIKKEVDNVLYVSLFGRTPEEIRESLCVPPTFDLRENLDSQSVQNIEFCEMAATRRIAIHGENPVDAIKEVISVNKMAGANIFARKSLF